MKKLLIASLFALLPTSAVFAQDLVSADSALIQEMNESQMDAVSGQGLTITSADVLAALPKISSALNTISPLLPQQGKSVVKLVQVASNVAPIVNNLVNGGKPTTSDIVTLAQNGITAAIAIKSLTN